MNKALIKTLLYEIRERVALVEKEIEVDGTPAVPVIRAGENLQSYLDKGGEYIVEAGSSFEGTFQFGPPIKLTGEKVRIFGKSGPAFIHKPGTSDHYIKGFECTSNIHGPVYLCGYNELEKQNREELIPRRIVLEEISIPHHLGKRGFEINAGDVVVKNCAAKDIWTAGQDNQALWIMNTYGNIDVDGGIYSSGSECIMIGGDNEKITGLETKNCLFRNLSLYRPLAWKDDGVNRTVKNSFELKKGKNISLSNVLIDGCWKAGQDGFGIMITPTNGSSIQGVMFDQVQMRNVSNGINLTGFDATGVNKERTNGIVLNNISVITDTKNLGGLGRFILMQAIEDIRVENCFAYVDGTSVIYGSGMIMESIEVNNSAMNCGIYGINLAGGANASNLRNGAKVFNITNNTFAGASSVMKRNLPDNIYLSIEEFKGKYGLT